MSDGDEMVTVRFRGYTTDGPNGDYTWTAAHTTHVDGDKTQPVRVHIATFKDGSRVFVPGARYDELADAGTLNEYVRQCVAEED